MAKKTDTRLRDAQERISNAKHEVDTFASAKAKNPGSRELHLQLAAAKRKLETAEQALVDLKAQIARETFDERIASLRRDVALLEQSMGEVAEAMTHDPGSTALEEQLANLRKQRDSRLQAIENLQLAREAASRRDLEAEAAAKARELAELRERHEAAWKRAREASVQLVDHLAAAGPLWMTTLASLNEANALGRDLIRLANGPKLCQRVFGTLRADGHGALTEAVRGALSSTRIGIDGPNIHGVTISHVSAKEMMSPSELERRLREAFEMQREAGVPSREQQERPRTLSADERHIDLSAQRPPRPGKSNFQAVPTGHLVPLDEHGYKLGPKPAEGTL